MGRSLRINTNSWNKIRYTLYTPIYDLIGNVFKKSRKKSIDALQIQPGDRVLLVGAGTGLDLEFLPKSCHIVATDLTPSMVEKIKERSLQLHLDVEAMVMDGQQLDFQAHSFDQIILHLILAVIPQPNAGILEAERVLKAGGLVTVFDKFVPSGTSASPLRKIANKFTNLFFSDITRDFESIVGKTSLTVVSDQAADFKGNFRIILLKK